MMEKVVNVRVRNQEKPEQIKIINKDRMCLGIKQNKKKDGGVCTTMARG